MMLNIYFGDTEKAIYNTSMFFDNSYMDSWLEDGFAKKMILAVDKATVLSPNALDSKALGVIPVKQLSGGSKTLLLIHNMPQKIFNASTCGDNCARWILEIAKHAKQDITINLHHIMDFGNKDFKIRILNTGTIVHNMGELVVVAGNCLQGGDKA